ncbi:MAG: cytochrome c3 family protein [Planctomycetota bacterium]|jgi:hypothetical protein
MAQIFHPSFNTISRVSILGAVFIVGLMLVAFAALTRSSYATQQGVPVEQPVAFSHKHHVSGLGIDCRFCHTTVETGAFAGIPPTKTCMSCHSQVWPDAPILEPVRESYRTNKSLEWIRVHDLPDFAYFDHSIHLTKGIGCTTCHGPIGEMNLTWLANPLHMEWCLDCHRDPAKYIRPRERVFDPDWDPKSLTREERDALVAEYKAGSATSCSVCHR